MSNKNFLIKNGLSIGADNEVISSARAASFESATISGDLTVDTSTLKVDSSNNRVGIGTASPDAKLQIMNNDGSSYRFGYGGTSDVYLDADNVYIRTDNGGANTAIFTTTGLGIGTTSPSTNLHIKGADSASTAKLTIEADDTADAKASIVLKSRDCSNANKDWELFIDEGYGVGISRTSTGPYGIKKMASNTQISAGDGWVILTGFTTNTSDLGSHFSGGIFTAPVTGIYSIGSHFMVYDVSSTNYFLLKGNHVNSSNSGIQEYYVKHTEYTEGSGDSHNYYGYDSHQSLNLYMSKGDKYRYEAFSGSGSGYIGTGSFFSVCLIG